MGNDKLIEIDTFKEILHASAKAAQLPVETYIQKMVNDQEFTCPSLSKEILVVIKFKIMLLHTEKKLEQIRQNLVKIKSHYVDSDLDSQLLGRIREKIDTIDQLLCKIRKARLNINFHLS
jgi:hypothetical protein